MSSREKIWLRDLIKATRIKTEGRDNAERVRQLLQQKGFVCSIPVSDDALRFAFQADHATNGGHAEIRRFVINLSGFMLMLSPA